jgi:GH24 family phage-related lysozyme (muramidase)
MYKKMLEDMRKEIDTPVEVIAPTPARRGLVAQKTEEAPVEPTDPTSLMREWAKRIKASSSQFQQKKAETRLSAKPSAAPAAMPVEEPTKKPLVDRPSAFRGEMSEDGYEGGGDFSLDISDAASLLRQKEGFRSSPYWDVNAYRVGYGSDTITKPDGSIVRVTPNVMVTKEDAERDLERRIGNTTSKIVSKVGEQNWEVLPTKTKAALVSVAYNYGHLPNNVADRVKEGAGLGGIAEAVEALQVHNEGVNKARRRHEAALIRSGV